MADQALATTSTDLDRPSFIPVGDRTGAEHITRKDVKMPRLLVAQQMSPEVDSSNTSSFIPDLKVGELFNDLTKKSYGKGPLEFVVLRADPPLWVDFIPREQGGGVKDANVPFGDPRTIKDKDGKVAATQFYDFVVKLLPSGEDIALSLKGKAGVRAAQSLNGLIILRNSPVFAGNYLVNAAMAKNQKGTFAVYLFQNHGWAKSEKELADRQSLFEAMKDKELDIKREADNLDDLPDDATEFDTSKM